ncbi:hypothetical protein JCM10049v2_005866 [Rhodotorula toruloides]
MNGSDVEKHSIDLVIKKRRNEHKVSKRFRRIALEAGKKVYVHLVPRSNTRDVQRLSGKRAFLLDGASVLSNSYLHRHGEPSLDLVFDLDAVASDANLAFLLDQTDPSLPLDYNELACINMDKLVAKPQDSPLVALRRGRMRGIARDDGFLLHFQPVLSLVACVPLVSCVL